MTDVSGLELVEKTWEELGYKIRPLGWKVFVRTDPPPQKVGSLFLPPKQASFYGGMGHQRVVTATVLAVGPKVVGITVGERVVFRRLEFGHIARFDGDVYVGWIEMAQLAGFPEQQTDIAPLG